MPPISATEQAFTASLSTDIENLLIDIECARALLLHPHHSISPPKPSPNPSFTSHKSKSMIISFRKTNAPITKALLAGIKAAFRLVRSRSRKDYARLDERQALMACRRGSADSDATLVDDPVIPSLPSTRPTAPVDDAGYLLKVLGPIVATLQRLTPRVMRNNYLAAADDLCQVCEKIFLLLNDVSTMCNDRTGRDEHDLEMTSLMLGALRRKVEIERAEGKHIGQRELISANNDSDEEDDAESTENDVKPTSSPLLLQSQNPFVIHSTAIALFSSRRSSVAGKGIPICGRQEIQYTQVQQTWAENVIRLGSFQNPMLFIPSPIAVQPSAMAIARRQPLPVQID